MQLPDAVLRSVLRLPADDGAVIEANFVTVHAAADELLDAGSIDRQLIEFTADVFQRSKGYPDYALVYGHFRGKADQGDGVAMAVATRLDLVTVSPPALLLGAALTYALDQFRADVFGQALGQALFQASQILGSGIDQTVMHHGQRITQRLQGPQHAYDFLSNEMGHLSKVTVGAPAEGSLHEDTEAVWKLYEYRRDHPLETGILSGIDTIDSAHHGLRRGDLALVLGFTGHFKTTFTMSWAYKAAIRQGKHVAVVSCETALDDLRAIFYVMHATHPKFQDDPSYLTISVDAVVRGTLTRAQERFFKHVIDDLKTNTTYGRVVYREPSADMTVADIQRWAEARNRETEIALLLIDYLGLVKPSASLRAADTGSRLNDVIRSSKLLAMGFAAGRGVSLLSPFQASREGWKNAEKVGGKYRLSDFSWANEAEKSADVIYYVWLDDLLRSSKELAIGNLKTRVVPMIPDQFRIFVDPVTRLVDNLDLTSPAQAPVDIS